MQAKLRRAAYIVILVCIGIFAMSRVEGAAEAQVPYASPKRPAVARKTVEATPALQSANRQEAATPQPTAKPSSQPETAQKEANAAQQTDTANEQAAQAKSTPVIDVSRASEGKVTVTYDGGGSHKLRVQGPGKKSADYNVKGDGKKYTLTLTFGPGDYTITYLLKIAGSSKVAVGATATCSYSGGGATIIDQQEQGSSGAEAPQQISADDARFLGVTNEINWNTSQSAVKKASSLADSANTTKDKVKKIYSFVIQNIKYDYDVYGKLPSGYLPDIERTYETRKGICYDFSALFGGMLRSQGIPAKLCKGSATLVSGYHAWNTVLIDGKWYIVDTSSDSIYYQNNISPKMFKSSGDYAATKES